MLSPEQKLFHDGARLLRDGDLDAALDHFRRVYSAAESEGNRLLMAASLCEIAWACFKQGEIVTGLECAIGSKWLWRRLGNRAELARALSVEAMLFLDLGFVDEAYDISAEALDLARKSGDLALQAFALNARALALALNRHLDLAAEALDEANALAEQLANPAALAFYQLNLGFVHAKTATEHRDRGEPESAARHRETAIGLTEKAIVLASEGHDSWTQRVGLCNLAELLCENGQPAEAATLLAGFSAWSQSVHASQKIHLLYTSAIVLRANGDLDEAARLCREALALGEASGQLEHQVNTTETLARIMQDLGDFEAALNLHRRFHALYVQQSGETSRRRARVEEIRTEVMRLRTRAAELADLALSDPLTGIANRRSYDQIIERLAGQPIALAVFDIDHFKRVNDRFTHIVGDAVLQQVARIMIAQVGPHGHVARLGGEEFALIFPGAPEASALALCEGVRIAVANADWERVAPGLAVTVSAGLACGGGEEPAGALMQIADDRLYRAKAQGRNRVRGETDATFAMLPGSLVL